MKKQLFYLSVMSLILSHPLAQASRSRLTAIGQNSNGSLFVKDARNMFLNPAEINNVTQQANFEWGATASNTTPKAEGGIVHGTGSMNLGMQLGRVGEAALDAADGISDATLGLTNYPENSLEIIFGSGYDMKWGGAVHYVNSDTKTSQPTVADTESQIITGKFGLIMNNIAGYLHADLTNNTKSETSGVTTEYDGNLTLRLGGSYALDEGSVLGLAIDRESYDHDNGAGVTGEGNDMSIEFTWHRTLKKTETDMLYYSVGVILVDDEVKSNPAGTKNTTEKTALPVKIGVETKARDWMVLRGSVTQEVIINKDETKTGGNTTEKNNTDDTVVAAGVGFIFNENFTIDATFAGSTTGVFNTTNMFANVGMNYTF